MVWQMLAQSGPGRVAGEIMLWAGIAAAVALGTALAGVVVYRLVTRRGGADVPSAGFTLAELRRMREQGQLTDSEFEQAKAAMMARMPERRQPSDEDAGGEAPPGGPPQAGA